MNLIGNTIAIDKVPNGSTDIYRVSYIDEVQHVFSFNSFDEVLEFLADGGFIPEPTT